MGRRHRGAVEGLVPAEGDGSLRGFSVSVGYVLTPLMANQIADMLRDGGYTHTYE